MTVGNSHLLPCIWILHSPLVRAVLRKNDLLYPAKVLQRVSMLGWLISNDPIDVSRYVIKADMMDIALLYSISIADP
jgi:hypothetical protein